MSTRLIVGTIALACFSIFGLVASLTNLQMLDQVNDMLPRNEQFATLGWYFSKYQRLNREYKRLYPGGRLLLKVRVLIVLMFACLFLSAWGFGILRP